MAKKKLSKPNDKELDKQVLDGDAITIEDCKQFVCDAKKAQQEWKAVADESWREVERRNSMGKLDTNSGTSRQRRWMRFPLWWSCWKIRQPITLARLAIPVIKDTQGDDPFGRTACIIGERLTKGILKTFDAFTEFSSSNDDFLVTNLGWGRWHYKNTECLEEERIRVIEQEQEPLPPQMGSDGQPLPQEPLPPLFIAEDGREVDPEMLQRDDKGFYLTTGQQIYVDDEEVYFEAGLYPDLLVEADVPRWNKITRLAFKYHYNYREFVEKFGKSALDKLKQSELKDYKSGKKPICVYEYHDKVLKEVRWFAEDSEGFIQPKKMQAQAEGEAYDNSDLYGLSGFFPCAEPMIINQSTKCFYPTPEYYQVRDILEDISSIVTRMAQLTKAIRVRFLFDSSVGPLATLIGENWADGEGTGMGIPNLEQSLMNNKGSLANLVAYFPVDQLMQGLQNMYIAFEQRLNMFYNITGFSDLIRGQTSEADKTYGERQLEGKFALNRMEPYQRKVQEWIKDNYQIGMELALKMFSDETLDEYITPQTLDQEDKERYVPALDLLRSNRRRRFRVDFETDSTVSINQEWKKAQAIETANAVTKMMESVAQTAKDMPELADAELKIMKHTVAELTDGKLYIDEIADAIQSTIDKVNEPKEPAPDIEMKKLELMAQVEGQKAQLELRRIEFEEAKAMTADRLEQLQMQMDREIEAAKIEQKGQLEGFALQLEQIKMQNEAGASANELNMKAQALQAEIALSQEELQNKRSEFLLQAQEIASKTEVKQIELILDQRVAEQKQKLEELYMGLEKEKAMLSEREKWVTEMRLQEEHKLDLSKSMLEMEKTLKELKTSPTPVVVKIDSPKAKKKRKTGRIIRDAMGEPTHLEIDEEEID